LNSIRKYMISQKQSVPAPLPSEERKSATFGADILTIAGGTIFAQTLTAITSPFLARIYGPDAFGMLALFTSLVTTIAVVACLKYELSIMLPRSDRNAANLLGVSLTSAIIISILALPLLKLLQDPLLQRLNATELEPYLWLVAPAVFVSGTFVALNYWNSRNRKYRRLSIARIISAMATVGVQFGAGLAGFAYGGSLIAASIVGSGASALILGAQIWHDDGSMIRESLDPGEMAAEAARYRKFPLLDSWSSLLNVISWQLPTFLLSAFFSSSVVGYYALGMNVLQLPMSLIGSAIGQVFFQRAAEAKSDGTLAKIVEDTFLRLSVVGIFPILLLASIGRELFTVIFGPAWAEAGTFVQILALWTFFIFITSPICALFSVLERQGTFLVFNACLFVARAAALVVGGMSGDPRITLGVFSAVGVVAWAGLCIWLLREAGVPVQGISKRVGRYVMYSLPVLFLGVLPVDRLGIDVTQVMTAGALSAVIYYALALRDDKGLQLPIRRKIKRIVAPILGIIKL
jgi:lipopolysaccharide exporter